MAYHHVFRCCARMLGHIDLEGIDASASRSRNYTCLYCFVWPYIAADTYFCDSPSSMCKLSNLRIAAALSDGAVPHDQLSSAFGYELRCSGTWSRNLHQRPMQTQELCHLCRLLPKPVSAVPELICQ